MEKVSVRNAADSKQIKKAKKSSEINREEELSDIKKVLTTSEGKRFVWRVLERCKTFSSVWESSARIHYNAGQQDIGHFLMSEIVQADESLLFEMMKDNKQGEDNE